MLCTHTHTHTHTYKSTTLHWKVKRVRINVGVQAGRTYKRRHRSKQTEEVDRFSILPKATLRSVRLVPYSLAVCRTERKKKERNIAHKLNYNHHPILLLLPIHRRLRSSEEVERVEGKEGTDSYVAEAETGSAAAAAAEEAEARRS